jgi:hypothetical protein
MKEQALAQVKNRPPAVDGVNVLREYLQARVLTGLQQAGAFIPLAFMGGTALRFLYRVPRFSEDLDFTLERDAEGFDFETLLERVERSLVREGYVVTVKLNTRATVVKAMIGFPGLLGEAGLSPHADQHLRIRLEVDTGPPAGAGLAVSTINRFGILRIQHHDMPSLFAGKVAAVLAREYTKGRDYYDLFWYLSREPKLEPNIELLRNALQQTAPELAIRAAGDWRGSLAGRFESTDWADARRDVAPFLEHVGEGAMIDRETFEALLT